MNKDMVDEKGKVFEKPIIRKLKPKSLFSVDLDDTVNVPKMLIWYLISFALLAVFFIGFLLGAMVF